MLKIAVLAGILLSTLALGQEGGKRVALVIGNDAYTIGSLKNAVNDARAMEKALTTANFKVTLVANGRKSDMEEKIGQFIESLGPDDTAFFFYAGHGVQIDNENFLVPIDFASGNSVSAAKFASISMARVFDELARKHAKINIIVLDACRNNPVAEKYSLSSGLAQPQNAGPATFLAYSTGPGQVANDNPNGSNSYFTEALADFISRPKMTLELNEVFTRVKRQVANDTNDKQTPWVISSLKTDFYFQAPENLLSANDSSVAEKWMQDALRSEQQGDWPEAIDKINQILSRKAGGALEEAARRKLPYLIARQQAQESYDKGNYAEAGKQFEIALTSDPFALDAAFQGVNSYLLESALPDAVRLLKAIRVRGTSDAVNKANRMISELAPVYAEAGAELKAGVPNPPSIEEVFLTVTFGIPDWDAGTRVLRNSPVELGSQIRDVSSKFPPAAAVAAPTPEPSPNLIAQLTDVDKAFFHVEIVPSAAMRNLRIKKVGAASLTVNSSGAQRPGGKPVKISTDPPEADLSLDDDPGQKCKSPCLFSLLGNRQSIRASFAGHKTEVRNWDGTGDDLQIVLDPELGAIRLEGPRGNTPVLLDGEPAAQQVPVLVQVPVGKYQVMSVQNGAILNQQDVEVTTTVTPTVQVKR